MIVLSSLKKGVKIWYGMEFKVFREKKIYEPIIKRRFFNKHCFLILAPKFVIWKKNQDFGVY